MKVTLTNEEIRLALARYLVEDRDFPLDMGEILKKLTIGKDDGNAIQTIDIRAEIHMETSESFMNGPYR